MVARQSTRSSNRSHSDNARKRVCKACDRCRLKKSKCDGAKPCSRCRADDAICVFEGQKKAHDKVYPKGYVGMLEQQQVWLVYGLRALYCRSVQRKGWPGDPLKPMPNGHPLTHDLLTRLGALDHIQGERYEENPKVMQHKLWRNGMQNQIYSDSSSERPQSPAARSYLSSHVFSSFQQNTSLIRTAYNSSCRTTAQIKPEPGMAVTPNQKCQYALSIPGIVNPLALEGESQQLSGHNGFDPFDEVDLMTMADYVLNFDGSNPSRMYNRSMPMNWMPSGNYDEFL